MEIRNSLLNYETKQVKVRVGGDVLTVECIRDLNKTIDDLFEVLEKQGNPDLLEELCPYFGVIWPSAQGLVEYMATLFPVRFEELRVLEVGCGLALPSLYLAKKGAHVTATDFHPEVPTFLSKNIELNQVKNLRFENMNWTESFLPKQHLYHWVIGSDILYEKQHPEPVARALASYVKPGGKILLADPARPYLQRFSDAMKELGFSEKSTIVRVSDDIGMKDIFVLSFTRQ
jgi:2-polyprenyl-3-methyl-5-hydroxy-6-metoxy-1,4-benzoquinol methylase